MSIIHHHNFFRNVENLQLILNPIKKAIVILEHKNTTLADCFICLITMAASIKELSQVGTINFYNKYQAIFNKR